MLRFDIAPVCSNAYRFQAATTFIISSLYLLAALGHLPAWFQWAAVILVVGGLVRGFVSPHACPSYKVFEKITAAMGKPKKVNAGSKMFADKIAFLAASVMVITLITGSSIGMIPAVALIIFSFIDLTTGFCAACWAYGAYYKFRQPS